MSLELTSCWEVFSSNTKMHPRKVGLWLLHACSKHISYLVILFVVVVVDVDALASMHVKGSFVVAVKINSVMCNLVPG